MKKAIKINTELNDLVQFINEDEMHEEMGTAYSSVMLNPFVTWAKFILTDDKPNGNNQRIPKEEFANLIRSGLYMPLKMAFKEIADGHEDSFPLGVITHLKEDGNRIIALAALWSKERPDDVDMLKHRFTEGSQINISWEISFSESDLEDGGIQVLKGTELTAATIVGRPAYAGRTPMVAFAAKKWSKPYLESLPDSSYLYIQPNKQQNASGRTPQEFRHFAVYDINGIFDVTRIAEVSAEINSSTFADSVKNDAKSKISKLLNAMKTNASVGVDTVLEDELESADNSNSKAEEIKNTMDEKEFQELKSALDAAKAKITELENSITVANTTIAEKEAALATKDSALAELTAFKEGIESERAKAEKMASIRQKFADAKIAKEEKYFEDNADFLLGLEPASLDFMLQELASFSGSGQENSSQASTQAPNLVSKEGKVNIPELAKAMREMKK